MNTATFHRFMSRLALVAALLVMLVPATGRLLAGVEGPAVATGTHHGVVIQASEPTASDTAAPAMPGTPDAPVSGHLEDCAYCPLLASLLGQPGSTTPVTHADRRAPRFASADATVRRAWHPTGLGSRGPPRPL